MEKIKFSCIIPVHNQREDFLRKCLDSVCSSKYSNVEIIIINSESTNNSQEVIDSYNDSRIVKYLKKDEGVLKNYQYGVVKASGEYIVFVDSDDYIDSSMFDVLNEKLIPFNYDLVNYGFYFFDKVREWKLESRKNIHDELAFSGERFKNLLGTLDDRYDFLYYSRWCNCYKSKLLKQAITYSSKIRQFEDTSLNFIFLQLAQSLLVLDDYFYFNRLSRGSVTQSEKNEISTLINNYDIQINTIKNYFHNNSDSNLMNLFVFKVEFIKVTKLIKSGFFLDAKRIISKTFLRDFKRYYNKCDSKKTIKYFLLKFKLLRFYRRIACRNVEKKNNSKF